MCFLYIIKHGASLGVSGGHVTIRYPDGSVESIPKNTIDGISIFAKAVLSSSFVEHCLSKNIKVGFFSSSGVYRGSLSPSMSTNTKRLRTQIKLSENQEFCLAFSKKIVSAKINNQMVIIRRYTYNNKELADSAIKILRITKRKIQQAEKINQIIGYEGIASRYYFEFLSKIVFSPFQFTNRNRRPARDPFNSMLNLCYSLLTKEITGELSDRKVNPYIGFMHKEKAGHPALASDLIEEWRPVIVDSTILSLIQGHEIDIKEFAYNNNRCEISTKGIKIVVSKLEKKMEQQSTYLKYINSPVTFREAIWHQADKLSRMIDLSDPDKYTPITIR